MADIAERTLSSAEKLISFGGVGSALVIHAIDAWRCRVLPACRIATNCVSACKFNPA